jgi:hypothetical protein
MRKKSEHKTFLERSQGKGPQLGNLDPNMKWELK